MRSCRLDVSTGVKVDVLFCPTVGPILSGAIPGVGLYKVLIFSNMVCGQRSMGESYRLASLASVCTEVETYIVQADDHHRVLILPC